MCVECARTVTVCVCISIYLDAVRTDGAACIIKKEGAFSSPRRARCDPTARRGAGGRRPGKKPDYARKQTHTQAQHAPTEFSPPSAFRHLLLTERRHIAHTNRKEEEKNYRRGVFLSSFGFLTHATTFHNSATAYIHT